MRVIVTFFLTICIAWIFAFGLLSFGPILTIGLLVGIASLFFIMQKDEKSIVYLLFFWTTISGFLINVTFLGKVQTIAYVDDLLVGLMVVRILLTLPFKNLINKSNFVYIFWLLFIIHTLTSSLFNSISIKSTVNFISSYTKLLITIGYIVIYFESKDIKKLFLFTIGIMFAHFLTANIQFFSYNHGNFLIGSELKAGYGAGWEDSARGFFGMMGAHKLGHFSLIFFIVSISLWIFTNIRKWFLLAVVSFYTFYISYTQQDYIPLAFFLVFALNMFLKERNQMAIRPLVISLVIVVAIVGIGSLHNSRSLLVRRFYEYFTDTRKLSGIGKVQALNLVGRIMHDNPEYLLLGAGPESIKGGDINEKSGRLYKKYTLDRVASKVSSTLDYWWSSFITLVVEVGVVGYVIFWCPYILLFRAARRIYMSNNLQITSFEKGIAFALCHVSFLMLYISFMSNHLETYAITFPYAILAGFVLMANKKLLLQKGI